MMEMIVYHIQVSVKVNDLDKTDNDGELEQNFISTEVEIIASNYD